MAATTATVIKVVAHAADALHNATSKDKEQDSGLLIKAICFAIALIALIMALVITILTAPFEWEDPTLSQFQQEYTNLLNTDTTDGVVYSDSEIHLMVDYLDISESRKEILRQGLSLVGRVSYFWGGKSSAVGWDDRWGQLRQVTAAGSKSTGTIIPFGLDCTGYLDWIFLNAGVDTYPALYGYDWGEHITADELIPGDRVFVSDNSANGICHVGLYFGTDVSGDRLYLHCSGSSGVVLNSYSGFDLYARMYIGGEE